MLFAAWYYARVRGHQAAPVLARNSINILTRRNKGPRRARGSRSADGGPGSPWSSVATMKIAWRAFAHVAIICRWQKARCTTKPRRHEDMPLREHDPSWLRGFVVHLADGHARRDARGEALAIHGAQFSSHGDAASAARQLRVKSLLCRPRAAHCHVPTGCRSSAGTFKFPPSPCPAPASARSGNGGSCGRARPCPRYTRRRPRALRATSPGRPP
jgi:hypothetical protein